MLDIDDQEKIEELIANLDCQVDLPESWKDSFFSESGGIPTREDERRRFARRRIRTRALIDIEQTLPQIPREHQSYAVYTCDFSRNGISFLHTDQLFPMESLELYLPKLSFTVEVASCRRINERCFVIGTLMISEKSSESSRMRSVRACDN